MKWLSNIIDEQTGHNDTQTLTDIYIEMYGELAGWLVGSQMS